MISSLRKFGIKTGLRNYVVNMRCSRMALGDVVLASYPKSGNTWMRMMLSKLLSDGKASFDDLTHYVPELEELRSHTRFFDLHNGGRIVKTHESWRSTFRRGVYIVRDCRDVLVSYYNHQIRNGLFFGDISEFTHQFASGCVDGYGRWDNNVRSWRKAQLRWPSDYLLIKYEDLLVDTPSQLSHVCDFLGLNYSSESIKNAVALSSVRAMRSEELSSKSLGALAKKGESFVRSASSGTWKDVLKREDILLVEDLMSDMLQQLGYEPSS